MTFLRQIGICGLWFVAFLGCGTACRGWDYEGHRLIHRLALASLPPEFPGFVREPAAAERIAFLSGEADRWRNTPDLPLRHHNGPDHYFDVDYLPLAGLDVRKISPFRYEFLAAWMPARAANAAKFPEIGPESDAERVKTMPGFLPWAITEHYGRLKSGFSYLKTFEEGGTEDEIRNARENIVYVMGLMGHFVGDASQPLHTTRHFNGWVGENPKRYSTKRTIHAWIDGGYVGKVGLDEAAIFKRLRPARIVARSSRPPRDMFDAVMDYILAQFQHVETVYEMDKRGEFSGNGTVGLKGREFIGGQMLNAGQMLGDLWYTAWKEAGPDNYLRSYLARRKLSEARSSP